MSQIGATSDELEAATSGRSRFARRDWAFLGVLTVLVVALIADWRGVYHADEVVLGSDITGLDWLFLFAIDVVVFYLGVPLVVDRERTRSYWREIRTHRWATASLFVLVALTAFGLVGPVVFDPNEAPFGTAGPYGIPIAQPPVGVGVLDGAIPFCKGATRAGKCFGTWTYPLGTTTAGKDVFSILAVGMRVAVEMATIAIALIVPLATFVGTAAATYGGKVDELLMRYVDLQQSIPAFFVIILAQSTLGFINETMGGSLLLIVLVFGFLSWGGVARIIRSEAVEITEQAYVQSARSSGASTFHVVRHHVVPNAFSAIFTALTVQVGWLITLEVTLSFLGIGSATHLSLGYVITVAIRDPAFPTYYWWAVLFPAVALAAFVIAFQILGDALRDVTDPRTG